MELECQIWVWTWFIHKDMAVDIDDICFHFLTPCFQARVSKEKEQGPKVGVISINISLDIEPSPCSILSIIMVTSASCQLGFFFKYLLPGDVDHYRVCQCNHCLGKVINILFTTFSHSTRRQWDDVTDGQTWRWRDSTQQGKMNTGWRAAGTRRTRRRRRRTSLPR